MDDETLIAVTMTRADWLTVYTALMVSDNRTPLAGRMLSAIDAAIDTHTDSVLESTDVLREEE